VNVDFRPKVLHLIDSGGLYGAERMLLSLVMGQVHSGLMPMILSAGKPGEGEKPIEAEARRLGLPVKLWRMKPGLNLCGAKAILDWANDQDFQLIHSHGYKFNVLMGLWPESIRKIPLIATLHGYVRAKRFTKAWVYETIDRLILTRLWRVVLVSEAMKRQVPEKIARSSTTLVIPNGMNTSSIRESAAKEPADTVSGFLSRFDSIVLGVGRLSAEKGFDRLLEAFAVLRQSHESSGLIIIGEGKQRAVLEKQVSDLGLRNCVLLPGYVDEVPAVMKRSDVLCMPSLTEGLPITLLEAMAVGIPIVACDVGEIDKVLGHGAGGLIVRYEGASQLGGELAAVLDHKGSVDEQVKWARNRVETDYSANAMMESYLAVYRQVTQ
jgi:glycosyltransferase involved in cell wall biosynthesis|tara:strand:- start:10 stop:1152 length:1143 start_codon:yes stop_codon:yes gene_type:complete